MEFATVLLIVSSFFLAIVAGQDHGTFGQISSPSSYQRPKFRWWWPGGWIEPAEVSAEIKAMAHAGFGGAEIGDVRDSIKVDMDPTVYGWGQDRWNAGVQTAFEEAMNLGVHIDLTLGPHWPTGFPGYTPDSPETSKELVHGQAFVSPGQTFSGKLPLPVAAPSGNTTGNPNVKATPFLAAVLVARTTTTNESSSVVEFDPSTVEVVTQLVSNGTITWTAPSNGTYILVAAYCRGTGQIQNMYDGSPNAPKLTSPFPAYIVDHLSEAGVQAGKASYPNTSTASSTNTNPPSNGGSIFEDSLELKLHQYWTPNLLPEFQRLRGYDLTPFLLYLLQDTPTYTGDPTTAAQITNDFYATITTLYLTHRLAPLRTWTHTLGLTLRAQPYTLSFDSALAAAHLDIPEGESLGFASTPDAWRVLAAGRDVAYNTNTTTNTTTTTNTNTILSNELGASPSSAYGTSWRHLLATANLGMSLGASAAVIHGYPYRDGPDSVWPGYAPFTPLGTGGGSVGFADAWGPRMPQWEGAAGARKASGYLGVAQSVLQESRPSVEVAVLNLAWGVTAAWGDTGLGDGGFVYQFPTPALLGECGAGVDAEGRLGAPGYKALVVDNETAVDVATAEMVVGYGRVGLPVVVVGGRPGRTFGYGGDVEEAVGRLEEVWAELEALGSTRVVGSEADVPAALEALGVRPSVRYPEGPGNGSIITHRRVVDAGYLYWIYNNAETKLRTTVRLEGEGYPLKIDLWTGQVSPIPAFNFDDGYTALNVTLADGAAAAIYLGATNPFNVSELDTHLTDTTCGSFVKDNTIHIYSNTSCTATTSSGHVVSLSPNSSTPAPVALSSWTLVVEDWSPAHPNATGTAASETSKTLLPPVNLTTLAPWPEIQGLSNASGVGVYTTRVRLGGSNSTEASRLRVLLDMGDIEGTWELQINGRTVEGTDLFGSSPIDVTDYVTFAAYNEIKITVATTLWNKLIAVWPDVFGSEDPQDVGLLGPVTVVFADEIVVEHLGL